MASLAVDGTLMALIDWGQRKCTQTLNTEKNPWWAVDLEGSYELAHVVIHNRIFLCELNMPV